MCAAGMRCARCYRPRAISALAVALFGDVSSISGILSAAPALLQAKHSRDFEREADTFARQWLREHDIDETKFDAILCRMTKSAGQAATEAIDYFSSHPPTDERVRCSTRVRNSESVDRVASLRGAASSNSCSVSIASNL